MTNPGFVAESSLYRGGQYVGIALRQGSSQELIPSTPACHRLVQERLAQCNDEGILGRDLCGAIADMGHSICNL